MNARTSLFGLSSLVVALASTLSAATSYRSSGAVDASAQNACCKRGEACCLTLEPCCSAAASLPVAVVVPGTKSATAGLCCKGCEPGCGCCDDGDCVCPVCCCEGGSCGAACH